LLNEIRSHWLLEQCEGVLKLLSIYDNADFMILVLEYQSEGSLMETLKSNKKFTELEVRVIMEQLLLALDFCQQKRIIHRDIKPENILINQVKDEGKSFEIKVADLGLSKSIPDGKGLFFKCGTPGYIAPEIFNATKENPYDYKVDIFSAGSIFFNLLTGFYIFNGHNL
jgi:serine/threonine protein kinase